MPGYYETNTAVAGKCNSSIINVACGTATNNSSSVEESASESSSLPIIPIAVGVSVGILLVIVIIVVYFKCRKREEIQFKTDKYLERKDSSQPIGSSTSIESI